MIPPTTSERLFRPRYGYKGEVLECALCGADALFIAPAAIRSLTASLKAEGKSTRWVPTVEQEQERKRLHGEWHVTRTEARRGDHHYLLFPRTIKAQDFGF
jgi:hypothetical protein